MPWVSRANLVQRIRNTLRDEQGSLDNVTLMMIEDIISTYPKREKRCCDCDEGETCECVVFGLYDDYKKEYEYYV